MNVHLVHKVVHRLAQVEDQVKPNWGYLSKDSPNLKNLKNEYCI